MCTSPVIIKNPNYKQSHIGLNFLKDCENSHLAIPCGHCPDCIAVRQNNWVQRSEVESRKSHLFFATLTYDNKHLPVLIVPSEDDDVQYELPFADIHHVQLMMKNIRDNWKTSRTFKYLAVSELGGQRHRPHFHILFFVEKRAYDDENIIRGLEKDLWNLCFKYWSINIGSRKEPVYEPLFTYRRKFVGCKVQTNFDLHYVNPSLTTEGVANVFYYVTKYLLKPSSAESRRQQALHLNLEESMYESVWNIVKCRLLVSKGLGLCSKMETRETTVSFKDHGCPEYVQFYDAIMCSDDLPPDDIEKAYLNFIGAKPEKRRVLVPDAEICAQLHGQVCLLAGKFDYPVYINPNGQAYPLASYYRKKADVYNVQDALTIYYNYIEDKVEVAGFNELQSIKNKLQNYEKRVQQVDSHESFGVLEPSLFE